MAGSFDDTSRATSIAKTKASSLATIKFFNDELTRIFNINTFPDWVTNVMSGRINNKTPPIPPIGYRLTEPNADGYQFYEIGTEPVCEMPELPEDHSQPQVIEYTQQDVINVPPKDTRRTGQVVTGKILIALGANPIEVGDPTSLWIKVERANSFGVAKFYSRLDAE